MRDFFRQMTAYLGECPPAEPTPRWAQWLAYPLGAGLIALAAYGAAALVQ